MKKFLFFVFDADTWEDFAWNAGGCTLAIGISYFALILLFTQCAAERCN